MPQNDFLIFNQNNTNTLTQSEFQSDGQRVDGLQGGIARSKLHNKVLRQASIAVNALSRLIIDSGNDALDTDPEAYYTNLKSVIAQVQQATEQIAGTVKFASNADVDNINPNDEYTANDTKAVTLRKIVRGIKNKKLIRQSSQTTEGVTRFVLQTELTSASPPAVAVSADVLKNVLKNEPNILIGNAKKFITGSGQSGIVTIAGDAGISNPENTGYADYIVPNFDQSKNLIKYYLQDTSFIANATTTKAGKIRIATDAEAKAGTDNTTAITPLLLKQLKESGILGGVKNIYRGTYSATTSVSSSTFPQNINLSKSFYIITNSFAPAGGSYNGPYVTLRVDRIEYYTSGNQVDGTWQVIEYY